MHICEFQDMMRQIYFHHDSKRGAKGTYLWLVEEVEELGEAVKGKDKKALENEFADVLAWLASLANVVGVNLEEAAMAKYNQKCPRCKQVPCECTRSFNPKHRNSSDKSLLSGACQFPLERSLPLTGNNLLGFKKV